LDLELFFNQQQKIIGIGIEILFFDLNDSITNIKKEEIDPNNPKYNLLKEQFRAWRLSDDIKIYVSCPGYY